VPGAEVHDLVCRAHDAGLVFHHHNRVAGVAQLLENADEPIGIARVEPDAGLIQHEKRVDQPGAKAARQVHPLNLPAGEGPCGPIQGEIAETNLLDELKPRMHLGQHQAQRIAPVRLAFRAQRFNHPERVAYWQPVKLR